MPSPAEDTLRMLQAGGYVAAVAVPVAVVCGLVARWRFGTLCPRWRMPPFVWPGFVILGFFIASLFTPYLSLLVERTGFYNAVYPTGYPAPPADADPADAATVRRTLQIIWISLVTVPSLLFAAVMVRSFIFRRPVLWAKELQQFPRTIALGVLGWATFGVLAVAIHVGLVFLFDTLGWPITEHPLARMGPNGDGYGGLLLTLSACVCAPLVEEFLYRGLLVPWAAGRTKRRWYRPWSLLLVAEVLALGSGLRADGTFDSPAQVFVWVLALGAILIQRFGPVWPKFPTQIAMAVWSSSALFAAAHSSVWPTPIPLFVLALGLGYLAARTRSWAAGAVTHILFNAVSTVWVFLRG